MKLRRSLGTCLPWLPIALVGLLPLASCSDGSPASPDAAVQVDAAPQKDASGSDAGVDAMSTDAMSTDADAASTDAAEDGSVAKKRVFVTKKAHSGNLGGAVGADAVCAAAATDAGLLGTFAAWLSETPSTFGQDRVGTGPWYRVDNALVGSLLELVSTGPKVRINLDQFGTPLNIGDDIVLTGGSPEAIKLTCQNWTMTDFSSRVTSGSVTLTNTTRAWLDAGDNASCAIGGHLYCFQK